MGGVGHVNQGQMPDGGDIGMPGGAGALGPRYEEEAEDREEEEDEDEDLIDSRNNVITQAELFRSYSD